VVSAEVLGFTSFCPTYRTISQTVRSLSFIDNKIDKGACIEYNRLSDRRKFLRSLWMTPLPLMLYAFPDELFWFLTEITGLSIFTKTIVI
jgi:hypothetical protein